MTGQHPTERRFEGAVIEKHLKSIGFKSINFKKYDRELCLLPEEFLSFIKDSQPEKYESLIEQFGSSTDDTILKKLSESIGKHGLIHTLRNPLSSRGVHLDTFFRQPKSSLNPEHIELYNKNSFSIVRQLHFSPSSEQSVDIGLFLNGIPLLTIELKNQLTGQNIKDAEKQYRNDRDPKEKLFNFKRCLVHFAVDNDNVSMTTRLSGSKTRFLPYNKAIPNPDSGGYRSEYLWKEILTTDSLLDIIENFVHISEEEEKVFNNETQKIEVKKSTVLIFPRYHQLNVIRKLKNQVRSDGVGNSYLIQHTTGSGKSFEIGWLSHLLTSLYQSDTDTKRMFDTIIVITDRKVLDKQLQNTIKSLEQTSGVVKPVDESSEQLKKYLESGKDIIITTIQKFPFIANAISSLGDRKFGVIIDEVHSSQTGERSKDLKKALSKHDLIDGDYEDYLRAEIGSRGQQSHISFFGFTGTPKNKTLELFGTKGEDDKFHPFDTYSMYQSIHEGFTLDVLQNYTTYKRYFKVKEKSGQDIEVPSNKAKQELVKYVDSQPETIRDKSSIILDHFIKYASKEIQGTARGMIVVRSRDHCVKYFKEINSQLEDRGIHYKALVAFSDKIDDQTETGLNQTIGHNKKELIEDGLKNPKYRLLIVSDKFQTGFNEPLVQSMYVDKKLGGAQCVQTLSRLNRTKSGKDKTFILDFVNELTDIVESFQPYYTTTILEGETDPDQLYEFQTHINSFNLFTPVDVDEFCKIFYQENRDDGLLQPILNQTVDHFNQIEDEKKKDEFKSLIKAFMRLYSYVSQIMTFTDIDIEKLFIFLRFLNKKLPKKEIDKLDISDAVDMDSLRIQKIFEGKGDLKNDGETTIDGTVFGVGESTEDELDLLSEIIKLVNDKFGSTLTDDDKIDLSNLDKRMQEDKELEEIWRGDSSSTNKHKFFEEKFDKIMLSYVNDRFGFYKKMEDEQIRSFIIRELKKSYSEKIKSENI